jgi:uncharacterized protein
VSEPSLPILNPEAEPFWEACAQGRLSIQRCLDCGEPFFFPRAFCPRCSSDRLEWFDCSGRATLYTFTVVRRQAIAGLPAPYLLALVDLEEGPRMMTHVVEADPARLEPGAPLRVTFRGEIGGRPLPLFRPA